MYYMVTKSEKDDLYEKLLLELRRGILILAVLSQLHEKQYGYALKQALDEKGLEINEGTLYPLLRRLESQGLLESDWEVVDDARPRRYYRISPAGETIYSNLTREWQSIGIVMDHLLFGLSGDDKWKLMN
jgi:DNA-binding PadR family transcriptional regulator